MKSSSLSFLRRATLPVLLVAGFVLQAAPAPAAPPVPDGKPHTFTIGDRQFLLDGHPFQIIAGEMHFGRVLPADWDLRLAQAKAMGLNTVSFYLFWNQCEPQQGHFTFTGMTDVRRVLELCEKHGLWAILRPGPYCCAETEYGGIPAWTLRYPNVKVRTNDPQYVAWSRAYIDQVARQVRDLQVTHGGPLLMVQMENEYSLVSWGNHGNIDYLRSLKKIFRQAGFDVPLFTCDPFLAPERTPASRLPGVLRARNGLHTERGYKQTLSVIGDNPLYVPEVYTAWFSGWGQPIARRHSTVADTVAWTNFLLDHHCSFCYYMFFGGTNYGFSNGCNQYLPVQTSYDYSAPIDEAGRITPKYRALRKLFIERLHIHPPPPPPDPPVISLPPIKLDQTEPLLATLPDRPTRVSAQPVSMADLGQDYGFVLYRKHIDHAVHGTLDLLDARDYAIVMVNGRTVGRSYLGDGLDTNRMKLDVPGPFTLDVLVYNLGRISVPVTPRTQDRAHKGLLGGAVLDGRKLTGWDIYSLPYKSVDFTPSNAPVTGPTFYHGTFDVQRLGGTFLDMRPWSFGVVWVNGHNLGRYWYRGGLRSLFLPREWLRRGRNEITVLELHGAPKEPVISGVTHIIEEPAVPFPVRLDRPVLRAAAGPRPTNPAAP